jgi:hypothetical protein
MLAEQRRPEEGHVGQAGDLEVRPLAELFLGVADADEGREADPEQAEREPGRVLVGVEPDHEHAERRRQRRAGERAGSEAEPVVAGVHHGREAGHRGDQHDPLGTEVDDAGALVDQQAERGEGQHRARVERRRDQQRQGIHHAPVPFPAVFQRTR